MNNPRWTLLSFNSEPVYVLVPIAFKWHCLIKQKCLTMTHFTGIHSLCISDRISLLIQTAISRSASRLASNIGLLEKDAEAACVARFRLLQAKRDPLLQHGSPSRLFRDASHTLPSSFSMQHAKLDDLEPGEGLGCQVTRLVCQVLNMPPSQQCLADGRQCSALTSTTHTHALW